MLLLLLELELEEEVPGEGVVELSGHDVPGTHPQDLTMQTMLFTSLALVKSKSSNMQQSRLPLQPPTKGIHLPSAPLRS